MNENVDELVISQALAEKDRISEDEIEVEGSDIYWGTGKVAEVLGISRDVARNHINDFKEYFDVDKSKPGKGGHLRFPSNQIELLRNIVTIRKSKSVEETKEILDNPELGGMMGRTSVSNQSLAMMLTENNKFILEQMETLLKHHLESNEQHLLEDNQLLMRNNKDLSDKLDKMQQSYDALKESSENREKQIEVLMESNQRLQESNAELHNMLQLLLERVPDGTKKGLFSFLKKK